MLGWLCGRLGSGLGGFGGGDVLVNGESDVIRQSLGQVVIGGDAFQCGFLVMRQSDIGDFGQVFVLHGYSVSDSLTNAIYTNNYILVCCYLSRAFVSENNIWPFHCRGGEWFLQLEA